MTSEPVKAVFDCNVLLQALISDRGPSHACLRLVASADVTLFLCSDVLAEVADVALRPRLRDRFHTTAEHVERYLAELVSKAVILATPAPSFTACRDVDDNLYVDLAIAARAGFLVTRDKDLLALADRSTGEGAALAAAAPDLRIVTPAGFLQQLK